MNKTSIIVARIAAKEFIRRCDYVLKDAESLVNIAIGMGDKKTGALRRQSLELTRALAEMRKP